MNDRELEILIKAKNAIDAGVKAAQRSLQRLPDSAKKMQTAFVSAGAKVKAVMQAIRRNILIVTAAIAGLTLGLGKLIKTSADFQKFKFQFAAFTGSAKEAEAVFKRVVAFASSTPFTVSQVVQAATILKPLEQMGFQMEELLKASGNLAGAFNIELPLAALQLSKSFSAGIGAAELLRDRGVRTFIELRENIDLTKVPIEELRQILLKTFTDPNSPLAAGMDRISASFIGISSNFSDAVTNLSASFGDLFTQNDLFLVSLRASSIALNKFREIIEQNKESIMSFANEGLMALINGFKDLAKALIIVKNVLDIIVDGWRLLIQEINNFINNIPLLAKAMELMGKWIEKDAKLLGLLKDSAAENSPIIRKNLDDIARGTEKIDNLFSGLGKQASEELKLMKEGVDKLDEAMSKMANDTAPKVETAFQKMLKDLKILETAGQRFADTVTSSISDVLFETVTRESESFKEKMLDIFESLGKSIVRIITDMVAKVIVQMAIMKLSGAGGGTGGFNLGAIFGGGGGGIPPIGLGGGGGGVGGVGTAMQANNAMQGLANSSTRAIQANAQMARSMQGASQATQAATSGMGAFATAGFAAAAGLIGAFGGQFVGNKIKSGGLAGQGGKFGTLGALAGGALGFAVGGPVGAIIGAGLGGFAGGLFHYGGKVGHAKGILPRADYGMSNRQNDRLIVAQTGEGVISRQGMDRIGSDGLSRINRGEGIGGGGDYFDVKISAIDAKSFIHLMNENPDAVIKIVQKSIRKNSQLRRDMREHAS